MGTPCSNPGVTRKETDQGLRGADGVSGEGWTDLRAMETGQQRESGEGLGELEGKRGPGFRQLNARWWLLTELEAAGFLSQACQHQPRTEEFQVDRCHGTLNGPRWFTWPSSLSWKQPQHLPVYSLFT